MGSIDVAFTEGSKQSSVRSEARSTVLRQARSCRERLLAGALISTFLATVLFETVKDSLVCAAHRGRGILSCGDRIESGGMLNLEGNGERWVFRSGWGGGRDKGSPV